MLRIMPDDNDQTLSPYYPHPTPILAHYSYSM